MLKRIYTWAIMLFVLLSIYSASFMTITIADVVLLCIFPIYTIDLFLARRNKKAKIHKQLFLLIYFIIVHLLLIIAMNHDVFESDLILRTMRYISYLAIIAVFAKEYFDIRLAWRILRFLAVASSLFLFIQYILMRHFDVYLSGFIPGVMLADERLASLSYNFALGHITRPRSFFSEPAHYASFVLLYFGLALFGNYKKEKWGIIIAGAGLLVSGSATGILTQFGIIVLWLLKLFKEKPDKNRIQSIGLIFVTIAIFSTIAVNTTSFDSFMTRTFDTRVSITGRFGGYSAVFSLQNETLAEKVVGHGMKRFDSFIPAIPIIRYNFGMIGLAIFIGYSMRHILKKKNCNKIALIILFVSAFGTEIIMGRFIVLYLPFIIQISDEPIETLIWGNDELLLQGKII
ncbi:MAG: hypothetical protein ACLKAK_10080 [Alkaliphilus sp.]